MANIKPRGKRMKMRTITHLSRELIQTKLDKKLVQNKECLEVPRTNRDKHTTMYIEGETHPTHRLAYYAATGIDPKDFYVCHTCDNPLCCNPTHLFLGTAQDNMKDCVAKGRNLNRKNQAACVENFHAA